MHAVRKNIFIYKKNLITLEGLAKKNQNNISKSIRECIEFACHAIEQTGSFERAKEILYFNQTNDLRINDKIILRVEKVIKNPQKLPDSFLPEESIHEHYGYGKRIYQRLEEKLRKKDESVNRKDSVHPEITPGAHLEDIIEPDHHLDVHGGVD